MKLLITLCICCSVLFGQILYEEYFTGGATQLDWHPWYYDSLGIGDSMLVLSDTSTPGGDDWAGRISNEYMGMAGLTYAGVSNLDDYSVEAWVYTIVTGAMGPYNGIAMRMNTSTTSFYSLVSDFDGDARLRLRYFSGATPTVIRDWSSGEIPGGVPSTSSWHKMKLMMVADSIWAYYDDVMLPGCPYTDNQIAQGYFGVYVFNFSDTTSTKCDNIIVRAAQSGIAENRPNITPDITHISVYPNPFSKQTAIHYALNTKHYKETDKTMTIKIYDASGRIVKILLPPTVYCLLPTGITWDGTDNTGNKLPAGVYFIDLSSGDCRLTEEVTVLR